MLTNLSVSNVAVIKKLQLSAGSGLTVLSGETGAGKSIIIDSINMVLGERTNKSLVRFGEAKAIVHYADSKADTEVRLQDEYEKTDENERLIRMKNTKAVEAKTFDMSAGEHKNQYYITANIDVSDYEVTVNGEKFVEDNGFRIYISYVVQKA